MQAGGRWGEGWAENRYKSLFQSMDLTRDFYFSYTYDLTNTLQTNTLQAGRAGAAEREREKERDKGAGGGGAAPPKPRDKFIWNTHLMSGLLQAGAGSAWLVHLVHGSFRQCSLSLKGRNLTLTVVARRSRFFAGARLLKRGLSAAGHVANEARRSPPETRRAPARGSRPPLPRARPNIRPAFLPPGRWRRSRSAPTARAARCTRRG
jgi:hypothetical protein